MYIQIKQVSHENRCKIVDFFGSKNIVQEIPLGGLRMFTLDIILDQNISIQSDDNRIKFVKQLDKKTIQEMIFEPTMYLRISIY